MAQDSSPAPSPDRAQEQERDRDGSTEAEAIFQAMQAKAKEAAAKGFQPSRDLPPDLNSLNYDQFRLIAFEHEKSIWKAQALPFWMELFHRGYIFREEVQISLLPAGATSTAELKPLLFQPELFQYRGELSGLKPPADLGYAGLKIIGKFPSSEHPLEMASFLGASYFRAISPGQFYGTSARGLALDIGMTKVEEFPSFREFWVEEPAPGAKQLRLWAFLDSPSVAGAYAFVLHPGETMTIDVQAQLFFRRVPNKVGLAPLTSMWMWGQGKAGPEDDPRPRVHDSDSLLIHTSDGRWIRRSLIRLEYPSLSNYDLEGIHGFGLMQAERDPVHYRDEEAKYHLRPSIWIEPKEPWRNGSVQLLELPAEHEGVDNIAAWWVPREPVSLEEPLNLDYQISFLSGPPRQHKAAIASSFHIERAKPSSFGLTVVFSGDAVSNWPTDRTLVPHVLVQRGSAKEVSVRRTAINTVEVSCQLIPGTEAMEIEVFLTAEDKLFSESWRYLCPI